MRVRRPHHAARFFVAAAAVAAEARAGAPLAALESPNVDYIEALERNTHIAYPALLVLVVLLIGLGIVQAIRSEGLSAVTKAEIRRRVLHALRRNAAGLTAKELARLLALPTHKVGKLLEEMSEEELIEQSADEEGFATWQITEAEKARHEEARKRRERNRGQARGAP